MKLIIFIMLFFVPCIALAQGAMAHPDDMFGALMDLIVSIKGGGMMAIMISAMMFLMKILKSPIIPDSWFSNRTRGYKRLVLAILGVAMGIASTIFTGGAMMSAVFGGLVTSGGALAIYHAFKGATGK